MRFDILTELPKEHKPLDDLGERLEKCFCLFSEGPFAKTLKEHLPTLDHVINHAEGRENHPRYKECCELLCQLRGLFLLHLERSIRTSITAHWRKRFAGLSVPNVMKTSALAAKNSARPSAGSSSSAWQYVISCALGELIPFCPKPSQGSCIVLGTVEVENGRVVRVCNCPRSYVWLIRAIFFEVLLATLLGELACEAKSGSEYECEEDLEHEKGEACRSSWKFDTGTAASLIKLLGR